MTTPYEALLLLSFGGPECREDVLPFLEHVLRGKPVPRERMLEVAEHYYHFGGVSPINDQCRQLLAALSTELRTAGRHLPLYWGNRNWHPFLADTVRQMAQDGVRRALAFVPSAYSSYSGCRQYREDIERARAAVGVTAPTIDKLRPFFNHPRLIAAFTARVREALTRIPTARSVSTLLLFTAHSIPTAMANGCDYERQLRETMALIRQQVGPLAAELAFQSRSGPPSQPWLEPDVLDCLRTFHAAGRYTDVVIVPVGFMSDHMEVLYDLDYEAGQLCRDLGLHLVRAGTPGTHPEFVAMVRELIEERVEGTSPHCVGSLGPRPHVCPVDCCPAGRPAGMGQSSQGRDEGRATSDE
jgi:ferrochelatase